LEVNSKSCTESPLIAIVSSDICTKGTNVLMVFFSLPLACFPFEMVTRILSSE